MNKQYDTVEEGMVEMTGTGWFRIVLSKARKTYEYKKIVIESKDKKYLVSKYNEKQVFHENMPSEDVIVFCQRMLEDNYSQLNAWGDTEEIEIRVSKKGKIFFHSAPANHAVCAKHTEKHNRVKNYILKEGTIIEPLIDMGIFTKEGNVVHSMYDKYRQINRFIEIIDDSIKKNDCKHLNIIDFGCGKSYLTFVVYYYLTEIRKISVDIIGLDLKEDVIRKCNEAAQKYHYTHLSFEAGDINGFEAPFPVDMVITLHACDTATDYALYNAVRWDAKMIFSVPCCQHELNTQLAPKNLTLISKYGIVAERFCAAATDAVRANILEAYGYSAQIMEFVDLSHTPKNLLIRAVKNHKSDKRSAAAIREIEAVNEEFGFSPTLYELLIKRL